MAHRFAHALDLVLAALVDRQLDPARAEAAGASRRRRTVVELDTLLEPAQRLVVRRALDVGPATAARASEALSLTRASRGRSRDAGGSASRAGRPGRARRRSRPSAPEHAPAARDLRPGRAGSRAPARARRPRARRGPRARRRRHEALRERAPAAKARGAHRGTPRRSAATGR